MKSGNIIMKNAMVFGLLSCMLMVVLLTGCSSTNSTIDSLDGTWSNISEQEIIFEQYFDEYGNLIFTEPEYVRVTSIQFTTEKITEEEINEEFYDKPVTHRIENGSYTFFLGGNVVRSGGYEYNWTTQDLFFNDSDEWYNMDFNGESMEIRADEDSNVVYLTREES